MEVQSLVDGPRLADAAVADRPLDAPVVDVCEREALVDRTQRGPLPEDRLVVLGGESLADEAFAERPEDGAVGACFAGWLPDGGPALDAAVSASTAVWTAVPSPRLTATMGSRRTIPTEPVAVTVRSSRSRNGAATASGGSAAAMRTTVCVWWSPGVIPLPALLSHITASRHNRSLLGEARYYRVGVQRVRSSTIRSPFTATA
ncbi:MAG: hypothetical protein ABEJ90_02510 [Halobacterium sp.]